MITDTTSAREIIERFVKINPETDRIVQGDGRHLSNLQVDEESAGAVSSALSDFAKRYAAEFGEWVDANFATGNATDSALPIVDAIDRLERLNRAFDTRNRELEQELKQKDRDYTGVALEYQDLADENRRLKQELEIKTVVADARDATIRELRAELVGQLNSLLEKVVNDTPKFTRGGNGGDVLLEVGGETYRIPADHWCSDIANVSYYGEDGYGFYRAWEFHGNRPLDPVTCPLEVRKVPADF